MKSKILSVGIDIGTTTSQVIFSRLTVENQVAVSRVPQINITEKEILYRSSIHFTPLINHSTIDYPSLVHIIQKEYQKAQISPHDINVGAIIITGESSRKQNSEEVVHALGEIAGDFVVASAGTDLEGIIAGRGSGAAELSRKSRNIVANIDIGGGTSNIAIFEDGIPIDTACLDIGGRQIKFELGTLRISYIAPKTKILCERLALSLTVGAVASPTELDCLCTRYVELLEEALGIRKKTDDLELLMTDHLLSKNHSISAVVLSGGVAEIAYNPDNFKEPFVFGDIGIVFGLCLARGFSISLSESLEKIRATVIGAGAFTASLSGSTIHIKNDKLPIKNLPVIKFTEQEESDWNKLNIVIQQKTQWIWDNSLKGLVLAFELNKIMSYEDLQQFAQILVQAMSLPQSHQQIIVIVVENDYAKALGLILQSYSDFQFIVLDCIKLQDGEYLDIGEPLDIGYVVPVVVKSLIFNA